MKFDKFVGSKIYGIMDWILRLLILNVLMIVLSLLVLPMVPAYVAGYATIKHFKNNKSGNTFLIFFNNFKEYFIKSFFCGLIILVIGAIFGFAIFHYFLAFSEGSNFLFVFGFYFILFCSLILLIILFHLPMVITYFNFRIFDNLRFAFYMSLRFLILTFILILCWSLSALTLFYLLPLWSMIGLSGPLYIIEKFSKPYYVQIASNPNKEEDRSREDD